MIANHKQSYNMPNFETSTLNDEIFQFKIEKKSVR